MRKFEIITKYKDQLDESFIPRRATKESAGYDFKAAEDIVIPSHFNHLVSFLLKSEGDHLTIAKGKTLDEIKQFLKDNKLIKPTLVPTGIKAYMESDEYLGLKSRSSIPLNSLLIVANGEGVIDADYVNADNEGHIHGMFYNLSPFPIKIQKGDKIMQGIFIKYETVDNDMPVKEDRTGGFGHSGK